MAIYTARVRLLRGKTPVDEIWLENIRAKSEKKANNLAAFQASNYLTIDAGGLGSANGFEIILCARTSTLDKDGNPKNKEHSPTQKQLNLARKAQQDVTRGKKAAAPTAAAPPAPKIVKPRIKLNTKKFSEELRGDFKDPCSFKPSLCQSEIWVTGSGFGFNHLG